jgi:hypothetical protein
MRRHHRRRWRCEAVVKPLLRRRRRRRWCRSRCCWSCPTLGLWSPSSIADLAHDGLQALLKRSIVVLLGVPHGIPVYDVEKDISTREKDSTGKTEENDRTGKRQHWKDSTGCMAYQSRVPRMRPSHPATKRALFECFPCVCPEPVLVKS